MTVNTNALKTYAPKARKDFIAAMVSRAAKFGITEKEIVEQREQGDVVIVGADAFPKKVGEQRKRLISRIKEHGFDQAMEAMAYTWFNRLIAIRYMELHGLLDHGYRVLSHPSGNELPEILEHAEHLDFPGLDKGKVIDLKLDGTRDAELYRMLLIAQCTALHRAMPFLFERIDDETELLLPDNLLHSDSLIRKLVATVDEDQWQDIEIIGWLYQFYISEKKDQVFAGLKKNQKITAQNIPAATQLFTPHWIVRYLVENSLGRLWLLNRPDSRLAEQMDYYIAPEEPETDFLKIDKPEEIKVCDPACGSGHMLTSAFDLLYAIYEEEGYDPKDIPVLILEHNLTGIEIDDRAGELAAFALSMKAAAKLGRRRFLRLEIKPDICVLQNVSFTDSEMQDVAAVVGKDLFTDELRETLLQFEQAKNFGSLIVPKLRDPAETLRVVEARDFGGDLMLKEVKDRVMAVLRMAEALSPRYKVVIANPPYMNASGANGPLKNFLNTQYKKYKSDLFSAFCFRCLSLSEVSGVCGLMTPFVWMFISTHENLRKLFFSENTLLGLVRPSYTAFFQSAIVPICAFVVTRAKMPNLPAHYFDLGYLGNAEEQPQRFAQAKAGQLNNGRFSRTSKDIQSIPNSPVAYWIGEGTISAFASLPKLAEKYPVKSGIMTGNDTAFLRNWHEVSHSEICFGLRDSSEMTGKFYPMSKGGDFRKWFGNLAHVVNLENDAHAIKSSGLNYRLRGKSLYFQPYVTWSRITSSNIGFRLVDGGILFSDAAPGIFSAQDFLPTLAAANSNSSKHFLNALNPTLNFQTGDIERLPYYNISNLKATESLVSLARFDWNAYETSWDFQTLPLLSPDQRAETLKVTYASLRNRWRNMTDEMQRLEQENNRIFIDAYGLQDELTPAVPIGEITLTCNPAYRYGVKTSEADREARLLADTMKELVSYAIGCMMGRYSLAEPGLTYANSGNEDFDPSRYGDFPADDDGIVPITETEWFDDDATLRFEEFLKAGWSADAVRENLRFVAESLTSNGGNDPEKTIRNYVAKSFFKDHLKTYKKRPIYWLFSSGKLKAFECLVYLHRYNEGTLSRMRMEYVIPQQSRMAARIESLSDDIDAASSSAVRTKVQKKKDLMAKQLEELRAFDEELRHYADQRITLDLDDGVKVNYGKFGNLLAERKAITGEK